MTQIRRSAAVLFALTLAACGGGGDSSSSTIPIPNPTGVTTPLPVPTTSPASAGNAVLTVTANNRGPASVTSTTPALTELSVTITSYNGGNQLPASTAATTRMTLPAATTCSNPSPCQITIPAPAGTIAYTATTYAGSNAASTGVGTFTSTGAAGQTAATTIGGIYSSLSTISPPSFTLGTAATQPAAVKPIDPTGAAILDGAYANTGSGAVTFTDVDSSNATSVGLSLTGAFSSSVQSTAPSDTLYVHYNGGAYTSYQINGQSASVSLSNP